MYRWNRVARRSVGQLDTPAGEKGAAADEESVGPLACESREGGIDFLDGTGVEDVDLQPHGTGSQFYVSQVGRGDCGFGGIEEHGHTRGCGRQLTKEF